MGKTYYSVEDLKKFVRFEERGSEIWNPSDLEEFEFEGTYEITLQDMQAALHAIFEQKVSVSEVLTWYQCLDGAFTQALEPQDIIQLECEGECPLHEFPSDERGILNRVWRMIFFYVDDLELELYEARERSEECEVEPENESEFLPRVFRDAMTLIECFCQNQMLKKEQWIYPRFMKQALLLRYENEGGLLDASDEEKANFVKWIDELAAEDDIVALRIRCYGRYGGSAVYKQDFYAARDDAERLLELTENPGYANTLGYIYYYGRVNHGEPEYEKALQYFMFGAANGNHESIFKLADMYRNGYGVRKSEVTAYRMIAKLYDELLDQYEEGDDTCSFADVALRKGSMILHRGDDPETDSLDALEYLLPAEYAIERRMKEYHFYGDEVVASHIKRCIAEAKQIMQPERNTGRCETSYWPIMQLCDDDYKVMWKLKQLQSGKWSITFKRLAKRFEDEPNKIFLTIPELYYCTFTDTVKGYVEPIGEDVPRQGKMDDLDYSDDDDMEYVVLYYDDKPVLKLKGWDFDWRIKKPKKASGRIVRLVSISFSENGRLYDYLCDQDDIKIGDRVLVNGYEGETEVVVRDVKDVAEEDLNLPLERYKTVKKISE